MNQLYPGAYIQNRYRVLQALGKGGLGQTFDVDDGGVIKVLKVLTLERFDNAEGRQKAIDLFQREADVLSRLDHPGVPKVAQDGYFVLHDANTDPLYCLVMEKIAGENLERWLEAQDNQPITQTQAIAWLRQLVNILQPLHQSGVIHRDIKPANIMLKPDGQLVLIDFGGVREVTETYLRNVTGTGLVSPGYTPPEQMEGKAVLQSDFFAVGRTFVHLLTGLHPLDFDRDTRTGKLLWHKDAPHVAKPLADLLDYLMAAVPGRRPQTGELILKYLDEITATAETAVLSPKLLGASVPLKPVAPRKRGLWRNLTALFKVAGAAPHPWDKVALRRTLVGHEAAVSTIAISPDSQILVSGSYDNTIKLWSLQSKLLLKTLTGHCDRVTAVAVNPGGPCLASSSYDKTIHRWAFPDGRLQQVLTGHCHKVNTVIFSPNGRMLLSSSDRDIKIWSVQTGRLLRSLAEGRTDRVRAIALSPDGKLCAIGYLNGAIELWNPVTGQLVQTLANETGGITAMTFSPNGYWLAAGVGRILHLWDARTYKPMQTFDTSKEGSFAIAFSPDNQLLASGGDRDITLWHLQTGNLLHRLFSHTATICTLAFTPNGSCLASGSQDKTIKLWLPIP